MARPSRLDNPEFCQAVAEAFVEGVTREQAAEMFGVSTLHTITRWFRDPRVQARAGILAHDRMLRIVRKTDSEIARRLQAPGELDTDELIKIRKEFAPKTAKANEVGASPETTAETAEALESDPATQAALEEMIREAEAAQEV